MALLSEPLILAGILLVVGFVVMRLTYRQNPVLHFLIQLAPLAGFTAMLSVANIPPFEPTAAVEYSSVYVTITVFKVV